MEGCERLTTLTIEEPMKMTLRITDARFGGVNYNRTHDRK